MNRKSLTASAIILLASALVSTACGNDAGESGTQATSGAMTTSAAAGPSGTSPVEGEHNEADIRFAQEMIPHHRQAVEMAALVPSHSTDSRVIDLAARIQQAQDPEITAMTGWLQAWGAAVPEGTGHSGGHHGGMPGMMTDEQMAELEAAQGPEFDRMWLTMMIDHHEGAVQMAQTELAEGSDPQARTMAQQIVDAQQAEIQQMQAILEG
ncbi:DUF305 domain-containing protein [Nocardia carnea]|uniref:DUF305 domain-containing protein n=1 Tax=Nocardia carnea TaxID=37328 RepID=UPI002456A76E|nr:DUF305 domain-containing protein [Nocardia carnea]